VHDLDIGQASDLLAEDGHQAAIYLNGHDVPSLLGQDPSQIAQTSPNFHYCVLRRKVSSGSHAAQNHRISKEILAQSLVGM
jgi:hypothetical protein